MSTVKSKNVQVGTDTTPSNNFTWYQPVTPDGTVRLGRGDSGSVTDVMAVNSSGNVGVGTTSPSGRISTAVPDGTTTALYAERTGGAPVQFSVNFANQYSNLMSSGVLSLHTANTERMRIASDGQQSSVIPGGTVLYPEYKCRAWVNFNGTGTVAIRASGNVSSITDNGTGDYTVNFTNAFPDSNYAPTGIAVSYGTTDFGNEKICLVGQNNSYATSTPILMSTTQCRVGFGNATRQDNTTMCVAFFR